MTEQHAGIAEIRTIIAEALTLEKCRPCGCLYQAVEHLASIEPVASRIGATLEDAHELMQDRAYGCLGCVPCPPIDAMLMADDIARAAEAAKNRGQDSDQEMSAEA